MEAEELKPIVEKFEQVVVKVIEIGANREYPSDPAPATRVMVENLPYIEDGTASHLLDILYPHVGEETYPVIINIHGGGFSINSKDKIYRNYGLRLASAGPFAVVNINFRLSVDAPFPAQMEDVYAVLKFLEREHQKYKLDISRLFLCGDSSGGYMAALAACILTNPILREKYEWDTKIECKAVALNCAIFDFDTFMGEDIIFPMKKPILEKLFGRMDYREHEWYEFTSMLRYVTSDFPPAYIMDTASFSFIPEAKRFSARLREIGVPYKLHFYGSKHRLKHVFHLVAKYHKSAEVMKETIEFFENVLN